MKETIWSDGNKIGELGGGGQQQQRFIPPAAKEISLID